MYEFCIWITLQQSICKKFIKKENEKSASRNGGFYEILFYCKRENLL